MADKHILNDNRVTSTIRTINQYVRSADHTLLKDKVKTDFFAMSGNLVERLINKYQNRSAKTALVIDDAGLQVINRLHQEGIKDITLCFTRISAEQVTWVKSLLTLTFPLFPVKVIHGDDLKEGMKFDLIIANPPYGSIGANITKKIVDNVDFKEYVNLLPANDYKRNDSKNLYNYQSDMESVKDGFADAAVTTHVALIHKDKVNSMTLDEFERSQYIDPQLDKYFAENSKRNHYAIDEGITWFIFAEQHNIKTTLLLDHRCIANGHFAYTKNTDEYKWNAAEALSVSELEAANKSKSTPGRMNKYVVLFKTAIEKTNVVKFIYSKNGFRFFTKIFAGLNTDSTLALSKFFPKVDWTHEWTVEEILRDYGYTDEEIQAVIDDLKNNPNYKDMKD